MAVVLDSWAGYPGACGNRTGLWRCLRPAYLDTHPHVCRPGTELELYWWLHRLFSLWQRRIFRYWRLYYRPHVTQQSAFLVRAYRRCVSRWSLRFFIGITSAAAERPLLRHCHAWHSRGPTRVCGGEECWWRWWPDVIAASQLELVRLLFLCVPGTISALSADNCFPHTQPFRLCARRYP